MELAAKKNHAKYSKPLEFMIFLKYFDHCKVFSEEESHSLSKDQPWDHSIDFKPDTPETLKLKVYPMLQNRQEKLNCFVGKFWNTLEIWASWMALDTTLESAVDRVD